MPSNLRRNKLPMGIQLQDATWGGSQYRPPVPQAVAPAAPVAPVDPYAWTQGKRNPNEYADMVRRESASSGVTRPMPDMQPIKIPGSNMIRSPFGGALTQRGWEDLQNQMNLIHRPDARQQAQALEQGMMQQAAGGESSAPVPIRQIMNQTTPLIDDVMRMDPDSVDPTYRARWEKDSKGIRNKFADTMRRVGGINTLDKLMDVGDNLSKQYPHHPGFINEMLESFISRQPSMKREYDMMKMGEMAEDQGGEALQLLPELDQAKIRAQIKQADSGLINKKMAEDLGFLADKDGPGEYWKTDQQTGKRVRATGRDIADAARSMYGLEVDQESEEEQEATISGRMTTPDGQRLVVLSDGETRPETQSERFEWAIERLTQRNKPGDREKIEQLRAKSRGSI